MKRPSKKSPEQIAVDTVIKENGHQIIPQDNIKAKTYYNLSKTMHERLYKYTHCLTGQKKDTSDSQLIEKAKEYIAWANGPHEVELPLKSTFWRCQGIKMERVADFAKTNETFKDMVKAGDECIGAVRENLLRPDFTHIRNRQAVYVPEYKEHDEHMIAIRERIKHEIEKEDGLTPQQQQALFVSFMEPYIKGKGDKNEGTGTTK